MKQLLDLDQTDLDLIKERFKIPDGEIFDYPATCEQSGDDLLIRWAGKSPTGEPTDLVEGFCASVPLS